MIIWYQLCLRKPASCYRPEAANASGRYLSQALRICVRELSSSFLYFKQRDSKIKTPAMLFLALCFSLLSFHASPGRVPEKEAKALQGCAPVSIFPLIERTSIVIKHEHFGEGRFLFFPGIAIVHLYGTPYERGYQHGAMLSAEIKQSIESLRKEHPGSLETIKTLSFYKDLVDAPKFMREELLGMADGAEISMWELVWLNRALAEYGSPWKGEASRRSWERNPSFDTSEDSRQRWLAAGVPGWMLAVHHPEERSPYLTLTQPGSVFAMAGMRKAGCCLAKPEGAKNRTGLSRGLCGESKTEAKNYCSMSFSEAGHEVQAHFFGKSGLVCLSRDKGKSFGAFDMQSSTWRPSCPACAGMVEVASKKE